MYPLLFLAVGSAILLSPGKKKKKKKVTQKELPQATAKEQQVTEEIQESSVEGKAFSKTREVYHADDVHMIDARIDEEFGIALSIPEEVRSMGFDWELQAVPPKQNLNFLGKDIYNDTEVFFFEAKRKGHGSVVFHLHQPQHKHESLPEKVSEIKVEIR